MSLITDINNPPKEFYLDFKIPSWDYNEDEREEYKLKEKKIFEEKIKELLIIDEYKKFNLKLNYIKRYYINSISDLIKTQIEELQINLKKIYDQKRKLLEKDYEKWIESCISNPIIPKRKVKKLTELTNYEESKGWYEKKKFCNNYINNKILKLKGSMKTHVKTYIYSMCRNKNKNNEKVVYKDIFSMIEKFFNEKIYEKVPLDKFNKSFIINSNKFCDDEHILKKIRSTINNKFDELRDIYKIYIFRQYKEDIKKEEREENIKKVKTYKEEELKRKEQCAKFNIEYIPNKKMPGSIWLESRKNWKEWNYDDMERINKIKKLLKLYEKEMSIKNDCEKFNINYIEPTIIKNPLDSYKFESWCKENSNRHSSLENLINKEKTKELWINLSDKKKKRFVEYFNDKRMKKFKEEEEIKKKLEEQKKFAKEYRSQASYRSYRKEETTNEYVMIGGTGWSISRRKGESRSDFMERVGDAKRDYLDGLR
jgi:hypothetical protein